MSSKGTLHDYCIQGHPRAAIGRWLGVGAAVLAPLTTACLAKIPIHSLATFTVSSGLAYAGLYWIFNNKVWRWTEKLAVVPDLNGKWTVDGKSMSTPDGVVTHEWQGTVTITQKWDKIAIQLQTAKSRSHSESGSMFVSPTKEARLSYSYQNDPEMGEPELQKHQGFCEFVFDPTRQTAVGYYFNSLGRHTFGKMTLTKQLEAKK